MNRVYNCADTPQSYTLRELYPLLDDWQLEGATVNITDEAIDISFPNGYVRHYYRVW